MTIGIDINDISILSAGTEVVRKPRILSLIPRPQPVCFGHEAALGVVSTAQIFIWVEKCSSWVICLVTLFQLVPCEMVS